jgi:DNA-binding CsgD family transcriptional regulator/tetratricopeptide (TPR) repeat protein
MQAETVEGVADRGWLIVEAVLDVIEQLASVDPVVLAVEDLHWADPLTLRAVHSIARQISGLKLALLCTMRPGPHRLDVDQAVTALSSRGADHVELAPLHPQEAAELAGEVAGLPVGPRLLEQVGRAGGNPLFVIELMRSLGEDGALEIEGGRTESRRATLPPTLRLTLLRRLSRLPEETLDVLRAASILGSTFSVTELALIKGRTVAELVPSLTAARDAGLLIESGDRLAFRHVLVRDALYDDMPLAVRMGWHREAGIKLGAAGAPLERVGSHVALGAERGDADAVTWLLRAGRSAGSHAPATAVRLLEKAREITVPGDPMRDVLDVDLIEPLVRIGRPRDAETIALEVLGRGPAEDLEVLVRTGFAGALSIGARYLEAIHQIEQATIVAPEWERHSLTAAGSVLMVLAGRVAQASEAAERAIEAGERLGNDQALSIGLQTLSMAALATGEVHRAVSYAERSVTAARGIDAAWASSLRLWHGTALADADRLDEAEVVLQAGRRQAERTGDIARLPLYHWAIADVRLSAGDWDDAVTEARAGLGLIEETSTLVGDVFAQALCAHVSYHRGDTPSAGVSLDEAQRRVVPGSVEIGSEWMGWIEALLVESAGQPARAASLLAQVWDDNAPIRYLQATSRAMAPDLVRMLLATGDRPRASSVTAELEHSARLSATPTARGLALRCRGLVDDDAEILLESVAAHRQGPRPYLLAAASEDAAIALSRTARAGEATALVDEASAIYEGLDAAHDLDRLQSVLRSMCVRRARPSRRRPSFGWDSLTPSERKVIDLIVVGLTNREIAERLFVSRRTVATHVEHVLQKLGHANRVELAAEAARRSVIREAIPTAPTAPAGDRASPRRRPRDPHGG